MKQLQLIQELRRNGGEDAEHEFLYRNLSILDDKASALLGFNSIVLAAVAIFFTSARYLGERLTFLVALITMAMSCYLCLKVVWVHWSDSDTLRQPELYWMELITVRDKRTRTYRMAWFLAEFSLGLLVVGAIATAALA